ncbi:MAG: hypothetical protein HZA18_04480 [Nitrospirae bacterium]|nr:hypothetical protein [Nitrospirota bacterium]
MKKRVMGGLILLISILLLNGQSSHAFELNGFTDVSFNKSTKDRVGESRNGNFAFGTLDLYLAQTMDDIDILVELVVEEGDVLDLERVSLGYTFSDALRLRIGRFHTPLGFWNTAYHHGVQLQPTIERPEFLKFEDEGGILPVHVVGVYASGKVGTPVGVLEYGAMLGNGPKITNEGGRNVLDPNNISDNNPGKAIAFNAALSPAAVGGLKVGVSGHIAEVRSDSAVLTPVEVDQTILSADVVYTIANVDIAGEYFSIKDKDPSTDKDYTNSAYYGLITYTYKEKWIPYLMYENKAIKEADPYLISLGSLDTEETTAGLRYNINYRSSLKGEYRKITDGGVEWNEYAAQWALAF